MCIDNFKFKVVNFKVECVGYDPVENKEIFRKVDDSSSHIEIVYGEDMYISCEVDFEADVKKVFQHALRMKITKNTLLLLHATMISILKQCISLGVLVTDPRAIPWKKYISLNKDPHYAAYEYYSEY